MKKIITMSFVFFSLCLSALASAQSLYTQTGTDPTWSSILANNLIPVGQTSTAGIKGSKIDVNQDHPLISSSPYKDRAIQRDLQIHTLGNAGVPRADFPKWTRWYQEDGNTQVFRLFKGEDNVRNDRTEAPRIEAESPDYVDNGKVKNNAQWAEWSGTYTIVKPMKGALFQIWGSTADRTSGLMIIDIDADGRVIYNPRDNSGFQTMVENSVGKSFDIRIRDFGNKYEIYLNGNLFISKNLQRTTGCHFRWGMYGGQIVPQDSMIFVTGAQMKYSNDPAVSSSSASSKPASSVAASSEAASSEASSIAASSKPASSKPASSKAPSSSASLDQCDTTQECKSQYGNGATDCKNSGALNSVCMCGSVRCDAAASSKPASSKPASSKAASSTPSGDECDTTQQCKTRFGNRATDCKNSQSNDSVCMCGTVRCDR